MSNPAQELWACSRIRKNTSPLRILHSISCLWKLCLWSQGRLLIRGQGCLLIEFRICSLLSLHPYFGTLVSYSNPLRCTLLTSIDSVFERDGTVFCSVVVTFLTIQQAKDFVKFMVVVAVLYIGQSLGSFYCVNGADK